MPKQYEAPVTGDDGYERHPAFGIARISRIHATPGQVLFQSDLRHSEYIEVTLSEAARKRDLKHDWVHAEHVLAKFAMSMSQFASLVASGGTEGVPVTIDYDHGDRPGLLPESRLALTSAEVPAPQPRKRSRTSRRPKRPTSRRWRAKRRPRYATSSWGPCAP